MMVGTYFGSGPSLILDDDIDGELAGGWSFEGMDTKPLGDLPSHFDEISRFSALVVEGASFIAGGCFKNIFNDEKIKDVDVFFFNEEALAVAEKKFRNSAIYEMEYETERSIGFRHKTQNILVDLIRYRFGTPHQIIDEFDFTVCKFAYYIHEGRSYVAHHPNFFSHLESRCLWIEIKGEQRTVIINDEAPHLLNGDILFNRIVRYSGYGYEITDQAKQVLFETLKTYTGPVSATKRQY